MSAALRVIILAMAITAIVSEPLSSSEQTNEQAQAAYDAGNYQGADAIWRQLAETGDIESMFALAALLFEGPGDYPVNYVESANWNLKAAQLGHPRAQYNLGNAYQKGLGVTQDDEQAVYWWQRSAAQGMPNAAYNLGVQYLFGRGVPQDEKQALEKFQFAAARGHLDSRKVLSAWDSEIPEMASTVDVKPGTVVPRGLLKLMDSLEYILWVDLQAGDLHVLQRDAERFRLAMTMSVSIGKAGYGKLKQGDKKTPVGVYRLISHLTDQQLDDVYGSGAYTLNYPNALDKINQRDGSGIWLHGLPKGKDPQPLKESEGSVVLSNTLIEDLGRYVDLQSTPIVLDDQFEWVPGESQQPRRAELEQAIASWRSAWMLVNNDEYLSYYADDFTNLEKNLAEWKRYKRRIRASKKFINVTISQLNLLDYPSEPNMVLARFYQRYESSNFRDEGWKEQLWRKEDSGQWRIVYERG